MATSLFSVALGQALSFAQQYQAQQSIQNPTISAVLDIVNAVAPVLIDNPERQLGKRGERSIVEEPGPCEFCHSRPKRFDNGELRPFCGKACAMKSKESNSPMILDDPGNIDRGKCMFCRVRPRFCDGMRVHSYCSKTCAKNFDKCGSIGLHHFIKALNDPCLLCGGDCVRTGNPFCGEVCASLASKTAPRLLDVPAYHTMFTSVTNQFKLSWRHPDKACPTVKKVYMIVCKPSLVAKYEAYRSEVESRRHFLSMGRSAGNENRRWHGTVRACNLGDPGQGELCSSITCALCSIIRNSFDIKYVRKKTGWSRFGDGIYTSSTSSKAADYVKNVTQSPYRPMLLNKVIVGNGHKIMYDSTRLTAPPPGFDSVLAETGGSLNFDEVIVYSNRAILPAYLVMLEG